MEDRGLSVRETVNARKIRYGGEDLPTLFKGAREVVACKGKKSLTFRIGGQTDWEELAGVALGRSGNLKAPTVRVGKRYLVGFSADPWKEFFA